MNFDLLPENAFVSPSGNNLDEVKKLANMVFDLVAEFAANAENHKTLPGKEPFTLNNFSYTGLSNEDIIKEVGYILKQSMNPLSSDYIGHMDSIPTLISCLGEFISTSINNNLLSLEMSPVFSQMEDTVLKHIASLFGYSNKSGGVMTSGGSLANLQALVVARNHKLQVKEDGRYTSIH